MKARQLRPPEALRPSSLSYRQRRRESLCLFGTKLIPEDEDSSMVVSPKATRTRNTKSLAPSIDGDEVGKNEEQGFLMNPIEDFGTQEATEKTGFDGDDEYKRGLLTIGFITFLFATNSPVLHWAFTSGDNPPPVLFVNAAVSIVALVGLLLGGDTLEDTGTLPSDGNQTSSSNNNTGWLGGFELGIWKFLGTTSNLYGLAMTTAGHGALLIQLTTLIVPSTRALVYKESISTKLKISIGLALSGVVCFANDPTGTPSLLGDGLCVVAAICYSAYDLRLYEYGKVVDAVKPLITTKIATQALLSIGMLFLAPPSLVSEGTAAAASSWQESSDYLRALMASSECLPVVAAVVWSGVAVNAVAPFLQVGGQQIVGPTKCQTIYASQPLWAAVLAFVFLGERLGVSGVVGGTAFLVALALAATAESATTTILATNNGTKEATTATTQIPEPTMPVTTKDTISNTTAATIEFGADSFPSPIHGRYVGDLRGRKEKEEKRFSQNIDTFDAPLQKRGSVK
jgi:drug/metabolite transporter (DMT)-like permease